MISKLVPLIIEYLYDNNKGLFRLACPADAVLTDELGRRIGTLNGVVINEIPGARILSTGEIEIYEIPLDTTYDVRIVGTGAGTAEVNILLPLLGHNQMRDIKFNEVPLSENTKIAFQFNATTYENLSIDKNGDGIQDEVRNSF